jgi:hypothetical protein
MELYPEDLFSFIIISIFMLKLIKRVTHNVGENGGEKKIQYNNNNSKYTFTCFHLLVLYHHHQTHTETEKILTNHLERHKEEDQATVIMGRRDVALLMAAGRARCCRT